MKFLLVIFVLTLVFASVFLQTNPDNTTTRCVPCSRFNSECNSCACSEDGKYAMCSLVGCPPNATYPPYCTAGTTYQDGNYTCKCSSDGTYATCDDLPC